MGIGGLGAPTIAGTRSIGLSARGLRELPAEAAVALQVPFAAHGLAARGVQLHIEQRPDPPARRARAGAAVVLQQPTIDVAGPADIGAIAAFAEAAEDVDVARRFVRQGPAIAIASRGRRTDGP